MHDDEQDANSWERDEFTHRSCGTNWVVWGNVDGYIWHCTVMEQIKWREPEFQTVNVCSWWLRRMNLKPATRAVRKTARSIWSTWVMHCILCTKHAGTNKCMTKLCNHPLLVVSLFLWYSLFFWSEQPHPVEGSEIETSTLWKGPSCVTFPCHAQKSNVLAGWDSECWDNYHSGQNDYPFEFLLIQKQYLWVISSEENDNGTY